MIICEICGREFQKPCYYPPYDKVCMECFGEKLWREREQEYLEGASYIIIDGNLYSDGGYKKNPSRYEFLGHGDRIFKIKMNNGTEIVTNNLWCGGEIPETHRDILCDNAKFIKNL